MTGILQLVRSFDEADCKPGVGQRRMHATVSFNHSTEASSQPDASSAYTAAQFLGGFFFSHGRLYAA
jgi:hypothetical protein